MHRFLVGLFCCALTCATSSAQQNKPAPAQDSALFRDASSSPLLTGKAQADYAARERLLNGSNPPAPDLTPQEMNDIVRAIVAQRSVKTPSTPRIEFSPRPDADVGLGVLIAIGVAIVVFAGWWGLGALLANRRNRPISDADAEAPSSAIAEAAPVPSKRLEVPLMGFARFRVVSGAVFGIATFYVLASLLVLVLSVVIAVGLAVALLLARFGLWRLATPLIEPHVRLLVLLAKSAWTRERPEYFVALEPGEAPQLSAMVARLAAAFSVRPPKSIVVAMDASAWIELGGWHARSKSTQLGLGYDLIVGLSQEELEAVIAHEMAHAKFVQRGLKRALNKGVHRAARATNAVAQLVHAYRAARIGFDSGETALTLLRWCTSISAKRVAAYSRQDEFEADLGAARVCGGAPLRSALQRVQRIAEATSRIGWPERLAQMQTPGGLGRWLAETLQSHTAQPAGPAHELDEYATHPSDEDRFHALPETPATTPNAAPAVDLLEDTGELARRLMAEIQAKALNEEDRDTKERLRWLRRVRRRAKIRPLQWLALLVAAIGAIIAFFTFASWSIWTLAAGMSIIAAAMYGYRCARYRDHVPLPVPTLEQIRAGHEVEDDPETREARRKDTEVAIEPLCTGLDRNAACARLRQEGYAALERAEPLRAFVCYRRIDQLRADQPEAEMIGAVALAMLKTDATQFVNRIARSTGLHSSGSLWSAAWALYLMQQYENAEPMLGELKRRHPDVVTYAGLLASCQARRGKIQSALPNARDVFRDRPTSNARREILVDLLVWNGHQDEAEKRLTEVPIEGEPRLVLSMIRLQLTRGNRAEADRWLAQLSSAQNGNDLTSAGACYEQARYDERAVECYDAALRVGFYPAAELGLARLALHTRDYAAVERHALAAINLSRPLAPKALGPLPLFLSAMALLSATQPRSLGLRAWLVTAPAEKVLGAFQGRTFLVYEDRKSKAVETVGKVLTATLPDLPPIAADRFRVSAAPPDRQPIGAAWPGVQAIWT